MTSCTHTLAEFAAGLSARHLPMPVREKLVWHLTDAIACGWAASGTEIGELARNAARWQGLGGCFVWGSPDGHAPMAAAFANAMIINGLDHDDGVEIQGRGLGHPGASLVPAALAALQDAGQAVDAPSFLSALAAGFEINNRLIHALQPSAEGFARVYGVAQHQAIGAAVVAARMWQMDARAMHQAIGLAATLSQVPSLHKYNWQARPLITLKDGVAAAAQAGIQAAGMVRLGIVGSQEVLDGEQGYWRMRGSDRFDEAALVAGLGQDWFIRFGSFKAYPACRWIATALECLESILADTGWMAQDIAAIEVAGFARLVEDFMDVDPVNANDAQFSLPHTMAALVHRLVPGEQWYSPATMQRPDLRATRRLVSARLDAQLDAAWNDAGRKPGARVCVIHRDGRRQETHRQTPLGSTDRPLERDALGRKALRNVSGHISHPQRWLARLHSSAFWSQEVLTVSDLVSD